MAKKTQKAVVDRIFDKTVLSLEEIAARLNPYCPGGMTYTKLNVILMGGSFASLGLNAVLLAALLL